jgi:drug/metabolite transporter (DMT)-like permease
VPPLAVITALLTVNTVVLAPVAVFRLPEQVPSGEAVASLLALGLACTALAFPIFFALIAEAGAGRGTVITYVNPAVAVALGVAVLGEPVTAAMVAGFLAVIAGSWLSTGGTLPPGLLAGGRLRRARAGGRPSTAARTAGRAA